VADYRYFMIEGDGELSKKLLLAFVQLPAAKRPAEVNGYGIWDAREKKVLVPPDREGRLERHRRSLSVEKEEIAEREALIERIVNSAVFEEADGE
jgi:hypothetical protein